LRDATRLPLGRLLLVRSGRLAKTV
jgi:hypothetical protein